MTTQLARWGNSLGLRLPKSVAQAARLEEGDAVEILVEDGTILVRPARPTYVLRDLVARITPKNRHGQTEWGSVVGRESW